MKDNLSKSHMQFPYKSKFFSSQCAFLLLETIQYYHTRGSSKFALLLDASKAFDKVEYNKLFKLFITSDKEVIFYLVLFTVLVCLQGDWKSYAPISIKFLWEFGNSREKKRSYFGYDQTKVNEWTKNNYWEYHFGASILKGLPCGSSRHPKPLLDRLPQTILRVFNGCRSALGMTQPRPAILANNP